ncbi:MAG: SDR family NAD(P)-dependent oxidoreductase [Chloroflexi bacterium]|nr:SDR family NAD(P)-dependent oxidoreductase [Chloroflexota bacterium]
MEGKVCLITGATSGIGKATALALARSGATVVIVSREPSRVEAVAAELRTAAHNPNIIGMSADLASQSQIRQFAQTFTSRFPRCHVLVNNVGILLNARRVTDEGMEWTLALNHLGPFLLTNLLLDNLIAAGTADAHARIVNVSSSAHESAAGINFDDIQGIQRFNGNAAYAQSKLANIMFTYELARRLGSLPVTVNAVHPGGVATHFGREAGIYGVIIRLMRPFLLSPEKGAETVVFLASSPAVEQVTGQYFFNLQPVESSPASHDTEQQARLWRISEQLTGLTPDKLPV